MKLSFHQKVAVHSASLLVSTVILIFTELSKLALLSALGLVVYNLKNIIGSIINREETLNKMEQEQSPIKRLEESRRGNYQVSDFQNTVRSALVKRGEKNGGYLQQNKYWHNNYYFKSDKIEEVKGITLEELKRSRNIKEYDDSRFKLEFSTAKKIRTFLETQLPEDPAIISSIKKWIDVYFKQLGQPFSKIEFSQRQIGYSLSLIDQTVTSKISDDYDTMVVDFNAVEKVLQRCFSFSLSLQENPSANSISFQKLKEMMELIDRKDTIPYNYPNNLSPYQIKKELLEVRNRIQNLPDFSHPPNLLRMMLFLKHLRKQFPEEQIFFSGLEPGNQVREKGNSHIFKWQSQTSKIYYNKVAGIKSWNPSAGVLLFLVTVWKDYHRTNKGMIQEIKSILMM